MFLPVDGVLAFEAAERLAFVHHVEGKFLVDLSLTALELQFADRALRIHRSWLVMLDQVRGLGRATGELVLDVSTGFAIPVSRDRAATIRDALIARAIGTRR